MYRKAMTFETATTFKKSTKQCAGKLITKVEVFELCWLKILFRWILDKIKSLSSQARPELENFGKKDIRIFLTFLRFFLKVPEAQIL